MQAYIGLGSNIGDRRHYLIQALTLLKREPAIEVEAISRGYLTEAVTLDGSYQPPFLNAVCRATTTLGARQLLRRLQLIENRLGRVRHAPWASRTIDLDLLIYGSGKYQDADLTLPHPEVTQRSFVLVPLAEVAPHWRHPDSQRTPGEILEQLEDFQGGGKVLACYGSFS